MNHWISVPWNSHSPDGGSESFGSTAVPINVAMLAKMFPILAKNTNRLIAVQNQLTLGNVEGRDLRFLKNGK
jgi:hypothetical protein